jgi:hypothetical protein
MRHIEGRAQKVFLAVGEAADGHAKIMATAMRLSHEAKNLFGHGSRAGADRSARM